MKRPLPTFTRSDATAPEFSLAVASLGENTMKQFSHGLNGILGTLQQVFDATAGTILETMHRFSRQEFDRRTRAFDQWFWWREDSDEYHTCTGNSAAWCPSCGDCTCARDIDNLDAKHCPLHGETTIHFDTVNEDQVEDGRCIRCGMWEGFDHGPECYFRVEIGPFA